jgi:tRNA pseudouridine32 synthase / 23S rRNA pseudouridine746 synthase
MIPILYEDEDILAIDKPSGVSSIPERDLAVDSVVALLEKQLGRKLFVVHRLDKEVSGVMLFAKTPAAHRLLNGEFMDRRVCKTYLALVHGMMEDERGSMEKPIRQFGSGRMGVDESKGKPSRTDYAVIKKSDRFTCVEARPLTGRRHQIRVHLYHGGHPIVGDRMYGDKTVQAAFPRLMLHAKAIAFKKADGGELVVASPATEEFEKTVADLFSTPL